MQLLRFIIRIPSNLGKLAIRFYQKFLSFDHAFWAPWFGYPVCIHQPTCSEYTYEAIDRFGLIKGGVMGFFRILRCNPFSEGGYDPVPQKFSIRRTRIGE